MTEDKIIVKERVPTFHAFCFDWNTDPQEFVSLLRTKIGGNFMVLFQGTRRQITAEIDGTFSMSDTDWITFDESNNYKIYTNDNFWKKFENK